MIESAKEKARRYAKVYYQANRERLIAEAKQRYQANREHLLERGRVNRERPEVRSRKACLSLRKLYGITLAQYHQMLDAQGHRCAICSAHASEVTKGKLFVDHAHLTGRVRQLLCSRCNMAIGLFREDISAIQAAADYIKKHDTSIN